MEKNTRKRIMENLIRQHSASANELSLLLGSTQANIYHHLKVLMEYSLIEVIGRRQDGRGRPVNIYGVSRRSLGDGLAELSAILLEEYFESVTGREKEERLIHLARLLEENLVERTLGSLPNRLTNLVFNLNKIHYQARWEASETGPRILFNHCPFFSIIDHHPELCLIDAQLIEANIGQTITQCAKREHLDSGLTQCIFLVS